VEAVCSVEEWQDIIIIIIINTHLIIW
jgi:hypothetical protein